MESIKAGGAIVSCVDGEGKREANFTLIFAGCPLTPTLSKSFVSGLVEHLQNALLSVLE